MDVLPINERCFKKVVRAVGFSFATFLLGMGHGLNPPEKPSLPKEPSVVGDTSKGIQTGEIQFRFGYVRPNKEAKLKKQYQRAQAIVQRVISGGVDTLSFKEKLELWGGYEKLTFPYVRCPEEGLIRKGRRFRGTTVEYDGVQIHIVVPDDKTYPRDILTFGWKNSKELLDYLAKSVPGSLSEAKKVFPSIEFPPHMTFIAVPSTFRKTPLQGPGTVASSMGNRTFLNVGTIIAGRLFGNPDVSPDLNTWVSEEAFHHGSFKQTLSPTEVFSTYLSARITPLPAFPRLKNRDIAPRLLRYLAQNYSDDEGLQEYIHWFNQENHLDPLAEFTLMPFPANYGPEEKSEANLRKFMRSEEVTKAFRVALNEVNNDLAKHHAVWWITGLQLPVYKAVHQAFNQTSQRRRHL